MARKKTSGDEGEKWGREASLEGSCVCVCVCARARARARVRACGCVCWRVSGVRACCVPKCRCRCFCMRVCVCGERGGNRLCEKAARRGCSSLLRLQLLLQLISAVGRGLVSGEEISPPCAASTLRLYCGSVLGVLSLQLWHCGAVISVLLLRLSLRCYAVLLLRCCHRGVVIAVVFLRCCHCGAVIAVCYCGSRFIVSRFIGIASVALSCTCCRLLHHGSRFVAGLQHLFVAA